MRVQVVDPSAYTPPYDRAFSGALARAGADVELVTSRFAYGGVPPADGYRVNELFYRRAGRFGAADRARFPTKLAEHVPDMLRYRRHARAADVVHWQWLTVQPVDAYLLPPKRPRLLTAHDVLPREPRPGQIGATRRLLDKMDAVIVHSEHGAARLRVELGLEPERIHVIPHGAFDYLTRLPEERPLPPELQTVEGPVVLFFGLLRPYKGIELLIEAFHDIEGAELWVVGMPRMPLEPLRELASEVRGRVRFVPRFVDDSEIPAFFRRADIVALPYREIDQSGVLYTALAFGKPIVVSSVGGFDEVATQGAARAVPPNAPRELAATLHQLLDEPAERERLAQAAAAAAAGRYSWDSIAERTLTLYRALLDGHPSR
ncbi:MAG TPA: glycosyltransferase family 4 protein [Thermoleophilaceae bacterium]|nr:glycosyltransferase family 4 protein [Thermoleophilaceae bacterium]